MASRVHCVVVVLTLSLLVTSGAARGEKVEAFDLALSVSVDVGAVSMERFDQGLDRFVADIQGINPDIALKGTPRSHLALAIAPRFRLFLPHNAFIETGVGMIVHRGTMDFNIGTVPATMEYTNSSVEIPVLVGGHLSSFQHTNLYGAIGPTLLLRNRSDWSYDRGLVSSFSSSRGGGLEIQVGGEYFVHRVVSLTFALRYRYAKSSELSLNGGRFPPVQDLGELDYSGISLSLGGRWYSF